MNEMEEVARGTARALQAGARMRAMIEACREHIRDFHPSDITPIPLARAVCHPILGGKLRANPANDVPGPTFTVNGLRLAMSKGHLSCTWVAGKQCVTPSALREWLATTNDTRTSGIVVQHTPPSPRTHHEKKQGSASVANASAKLLSMKAALAKKKGK